MAIFSPSPPRQALCRSSFQLSSGRCNFNMVVTSSIVLLSLLSCIATASQWSIEELPGYTGKLPFKLETGYIGVGDMEDVQLFFYFIESERDPVKDPLMLWLTGGPGCSGLSGLMFEIGPLAFNYTDLYEGDLPSLQLNPYSWTKWLLRHPQFLENQLYVGGDSYSGLPVPMVVELIVNGNEMGRKPHMNIKGYVLGNPLTSDNSDSNARVKYAHRVSLLSDQLYQSAVSKCHGNFISVDPNNAQCIKVLQAVDDCIFHGVYIMHVLEPDCAAATPKRIIRQWDPSHIVSDEETNLVHLRRRRSELQHEVPGLWCRSYNYLPIYAWTNDKLVQEALHIREGTITHWYRCNKTLSGFKVNVNNTVPNHQRLANKFLRALVYSGDQDLLIPYVATLEWIKLLPLRVTTSWRPWYVEGQVAGYTTQYSNLKYRLTYTTLKGGGHTAPEYVPKEAFAMIQRWFDKYPF